MQKEEINGFAPEEIFKLYAFITAYEETGIKAYKNLQSLWIEHPELQGLALVLKKVNCHFSSSSTMKSVNFKKLQNEIFLTKYGDCTLFSILYHLRNSIAHGLAIKSGNSVLITDYKVSHPTDFSARGRIELNIINEFTDNLLKIKS